MMLSSNIEKCDAIGDLLKRIPDMVDSFSKKDSRSINIFMEWLSLSEKKLKEYNFVECSQIAGVRASLLHKKQTCQRKELFAYAASQVDVAQTILYNVYSPLNARIENVKLLFRQLLAPILLSGNFSFNPNEDISTQIENLIKSLRINDQISASINNAIVTVGKIDTIRIIADIFSSGL